MARKRTKPAGKTSQKPRSRDTERKYLAGESISSIAEREDLAAWLASQDVSLPYNVRHRLALLSEEIEGGKSPTEPAIGRRQKLRRLRTLLDNSTLREQVIFYLTADLIDTPSAIERYRKDKGGKTGLSNRLIKSEIWHAKWEPAVRSYVEANATPQWIANRLRKHPVEFGLKKGDRYPSRDTIIRAAEKLIKTVRE
jgi:hypothetical protein